MRPPRRLVAAATSIATVAAVSVVGVVAATPAAAAQYRQVSETPIGSGALLIALNQAGTRAYVTRYSNANRVSVFNTVAGTWDDSITGIQYPFGIAVNADDSIYVAENFTGAPGTKVFSVAPGATTPAGSATVAPRPAGVAVNSNLPGSADDTVYAAIVDSGWVSIINGATNTQDDTVAVGGAPLNVAVDLSDDTIYATVGDAKLAIINGRTLSVTPLLITGYGTNPDPWGVVVNSSNGRVYVSNYSVDTVSVIDGRANPPAIIATIPVGDQPTGLALNAAGTRLFVANSGSNSLSVIDTSSNTVVGLPTPVGNSPRGVAVGTVNGIETVFVANNGSGTLSSVTLNYAVNFDPNGGTGTMPAQYDDTPTALTTNAFTRSGYTFLGWNTAANGSGTSYGNGATYPFNADVTLYAQWQAPAPPPPPVFPPGPPLNPKAEPGYESATVSWEPPASSGTYPVTQYRVTSSPDGKTCLIAAPGGQGGAGGAGGAGTAAAPRSADPPWNYGEIKRINVGRNPMGVAVYDRGDEVFVANGGSGTVSMINGRTGAVTSTITVGSAPTAVGIDQGQGVAYAVNTGSGSVSQFDGQGTGTRPASATIPNVGNSPRSLAVDFGGTVYVANAGTQVTPSDAAVIDPFVNTVVRSIPLGVGPQGISLRQSTQTLYVAQNQGKSVWVANARTGKNIGNPINLSAGGHGIDINQKSGAAYVSTPSANQLAVIDTNPTSPTYNTITGTIPTLAGPTAVAVDQTNNKVFVTNRDASTVSIVDEATKTVTHTVRVGSNPGGVAIDQEGTNKGIAYVSNNFSNAVSVIAKITPTLLTTAGQAGTVVTISLDIPNLASDFTLADNTLSFAFFGGRGAGLATKVGPNTWTVRAPAGVTGTVPVSVSFNGGNRATAGSFTYQAAPQPISCKVPGLTPGVPYTFTVEAQSPAGWGNPSVPSNIAIPFGPAASKFTTPGIYQCTVVGGTEPGPVRIPFTVNGGKGGTGNQGFRFGTPNPGGFGASVAGSFQAAAGTTVYLTVGSNGLDAPVFVDDSTSAGGGGGGYSAISLGVTRDPIVVAGGGGGGANYDSAPTSPGVGKGGDSDPTSTKSGGGNGGNIHGVGEAGGTLETGGRGGDRGENGGDGGVNGVPGRDASDSRRKSGGGGGGGFGASGGNGRDPMVRETTWTTRPSAFGGGGGGGLDGGGGGGGYAGGGGGAGVINMQSAGGGGGGGSLLVSASTAAGITGKIDGALASNSTAPSVEVANLKCSFSVTYEGNGNTSGTVPSDPDWYASGATVTVADGGSLARDSQVFVGWATSQFGPVAYVPGSRISPVNAPVTLWAVYGAPKTVTFEANQGTGTMAPQKSGSAQALKPNAFTRVDYAFTGWNTKADGTGIAYANGATYSFSSDVTLYAQWKSAPTPKSEPIPEPLGPGQHYYEEDRTPKPIEVVPSPFGDGIVVVDTTWTMTLEGLNGAGDPLPLDDSGVLVLQAERDARTTGTGFLPNSLVGLFFDPAVDDTSGKPSPWKTVDLGTVSVDDNGDFSGIKRLPDEIKPGLHVLQAVGYGPAGERRALSIGILVVPWMELDQGTRSASGRHDRIKTSGTTGGIDTGERLAPWIKYNGQASFKGGKANIRVKADGSFTWSRLIKTSKGLTGYVSWRDIKSNEVYWPKVR